MSKNFSHEEQEEDDELALRSRRPFRPFIMTGVIILIALVVVGSIVTVNRVTNSTPALPTSTPLPGSNQFYFSVAPSWGTITVDGHLLSPVPEPGMGKPPLTLASGTHQVVWQIAPFPTMQCQISLPFRFSSQNCVNSNIPLTFPAVGGHPVAAYLLNFDLSLASLSSSQFDALNRAIQTTLNQLQGVTTMQTGEHFANSLYTSSDISSIDTTPTPLLATLDFALIISHNPQYGGCITGGLIDQPDSCNNQGQNCQLLCPVTESGTPSVKRWDLFALIGMFWTYAPPDDLQHPVLLGQPDPAAGGGNAFLVALSVQWDGSHWQVTFYHDKNVDRSLLANPACDAAQFVIGEDPRFLSVADSTQQIALKFVSGANPAAGCVAEAFAETPAGNVTSTHPLASCLYRFGVTLALDSAAHRSWPFLLQASPYEQSIAQQIIAQAHIT